MNRKLSILITICLLMIGMSFSVYPRIRGGRRDRGSRGMRSFGRHGWRRRRGGRRSALAIPALIGATTVAATAASDAAEARRGAEYYDEYYDYDDLNSDEYDGIDD